MRSYKYEYKISDKRFVPLEHALTHEYEIRKLAECVIEEKYGYGKKIHKLQKEQSELVHSTKAPKKVCPYCKTDKHSVYAKAFFESFIKEEHKAWKNTGIFEKIKQYFSSDRMFQTYYIEACENGLKLLSDENMLLVNICHKCFLSKQCRNNDYSVSYPFLIEEKESQEEWLKKNKEIDKNTEQIKALFDEKDGAINAFISSFNPSSIIKIKK